MTYNILRRIFPRKSNNNQAISPVIASILLIALTVSAAAIVYFVVVPLLQGDGKLVQMSTITLSDDDDDGKYDTATSKPVLNADGQKHHVFFERYSGACGFIAIESLCQARV